jgi:hypothetical protein
MYDQSFQTTRTTTGQQDSSRGSAKTGIDPVTGSLNVVTTPVTDQTPALSQVAAPEHGPDRAAALGAFAEANGREASPAEERLLAGIATEIGRSGQDGQALEATSGWAVVSAAIYEAVDSGSSFVAPKRVREIVRRWLRDGLPVEEASDASRREVGTHGNAFAAAEIQESESRSRWRSARGMEPESRAEGEELTDDGTGNDDRAPNTENRSPTPHAPHPTPSNRFWVEEGQISSTLLWETLVADLAERGVGRRADLEMYLRPSRFAGRSGERGFLLETPNQPARRRIELHWLTELERALAQLLGGTGWQIELTTREEMRHAG